MHTWRRVPRGLVTGAWLVCGVMLLVRAATAESAIDLLPFVRLASVLFAGVSVFALDDPAAPVTVSTEAGRLRLRAAVVAATLPAVAAAWLSIVLGARLIAGSPDELPVAGLLVELLALMAAGWFIAAMMNSEARDTDVAARAAGALVIMVAMTLSVPRLVHALWVGPGTEWNRSHGRWSAIACLAFGGFLWLSRDPAGRAVRHRVR